MSRRTFGTYNLKHPIIRETRDGDNEVREEDLKPAGFCVVIKRLRGKELKLLANFDGSYADLTLTMLGRISNLSDEELELADAEDLDELGNLLEAAMPKTKKAGSTNASGQETGSPASP